MTIEELEKRVQKLEKIGKLFDYLISAVDAIIGTIVSEGENLTNLQTTRDNLRKIRNKYTEITLKWGIEMRIITINLPEKYLQAIQILNDLEKYPSRSEVIRIALNDFLAKELKMYNDLDPDNFKMLIRSEGIKIE